MPKFYTIFARKIHFPRILGQFQPSRLCSRVSGLDANSNYVITVDIVLWVQSCQINCYAAPYTFTALAQMHRR